MLRAAIATRDQCLKVAVERTAFFLNPNLGAATGETMASLFRKHYGDGAPPKGAAATSDGVSETGRESDGAAPSPSGSDKLKRHAVQADADARARRVAFGLPALEPSVDPIAYDYDVEMSSSLDAQRLLFWAGGAEAKRKARGGPEARERLFEALVSRHFAKQGVYADRTMLVAAAEDAGLDPRAVKNYLDSGRDEDTIRQTFLRVMYGWGYSSIPVTLFSCEGEHYEIQGSRSLEDYVSVLQLCAAQDPKTYPNSRASWEDMDDKAKLSANWRDLEAKVFGRPDCGGLLKKLPG